MSARDFVDWELEWGEYIAARSRRLQDLGAKDGRWGTESEEFADLLNAFQDPDAMRPVGWWK